MARVRIVGDPDQPQTGDHSVELLVRHEEGIALRLDWLIPFLAIVERHAVAEINWQERPKGCADFQAQDRGDELGGQVAVARLDSRVVQLDVDTWVRLVVGHQWCVSGLGDPLERRSTQAPGSKEAEKVAAPWPATGSSRGRETYSCMAQGRPGSHATDLNDHRRRGQHRSSAVLQPQIDRSLW